MFVFMGWIQLYTQISLFSNTGENKFKEIAGRMIHLKI